MGLWPGSFSPELLYDTARSSFGPFLFLQNVRSHVCSVSHVEYKWLHALCKKRKGLRPECVESLNSRSCLVEEPLYVRLSATLTHSQIDAQTYMASPQTSSALPQTVACLPPSTPPSPAHIIAGVVVQSLPCAVFLRSPAYGN